MALTDGGLSIADAMALAKDGDNNGFLGGGMGIFFLFFLMMMMGGGGFGGVAAAQRAQAATTEDVQNQFNFAALERQNAEIVAAIGQTQYNITGSIRDAGFNTTLGQRDLAAAIAQLGFNQSQCCCETNRNIDAVKYENARNTCDIVNSANMNTRDLLEANNLGVQRILDFMTNDKIETLRSELQTAQLSLSNGLQTAEIISAVRPFPTPAYITASPYSSANGFGAAMAGFCG